MKLSVHKVRRSRGVVDSPVIKADVKGTILAQGCQWETRKWRGIYLTKDWANQILARMGYVKRKTTTKAEVSPTLFDSMKAIYSVTFRQ